MPQEKIQEIVNTMARLDTFISVLEGARLEIVASILSIRTALELDRFVVRYS